ncbi:uncharacterized protein TA02805 [Theileria annulata]|uniref:Uncharacterized protein n=1 Tax=Theileria annulata TaxID=5874 RepID=Q4UHL3_THEAN|nr:uncharacterized protein TA02805 [Theileria annulata]CAI73426.1 hypothetical protein TA02805 [Theileria annulata]|eukprot:XP_954103.1 hypothetical protein TA02805 [Theileria annulata]
MCIDFKLKQKEYSIIAPSRSVQGQDFNVICQSAKCGYKSNTIYNVVNPECGNYYTCQECPSSFGTDICYLGITNSDWINVTEGHMTLSKHDRVHDQQPKQNKTNTKDTYDYDEDEDSFLQLSTNWEDYGISLVDKIIISQTFKYVDHHDDKWLLENKRQCQIDTEGNLELSIRLMFQYYKSPLIMDYDDQSNLSTLQLNSSVTVLGQADSNNTNTSTNSKDSKDSKDTKETPLGAEAEDSGTVGPSTVTDDPVTENLILLQLGKNEEYYDDEEVGNEDNFFSHMTKKGLKYSLNTGKAVKHKLSDTFKFLYQKAQVIMAKPEVHIHFVVDDIRLKSCRQPLSWNGDMTSGAMIFVGNQNFKIHHTVLNSDFLKKAIRVNTNVKGVYELSFNSCVQIHCTKRQNFNQQSFNISHLSNFLTHNNPVNGMNQVTSMNRVNPVNGMNPVTGMNPFNSVNGMNSVSTINNVNLHIPKPIQPITNIPSFNSNHNTNLNTNNSNHNGTTIGSISNENPVTMDKKKLWLYGSIGVVIILIIISIPLMTKIF